MYYLIILAVIIFDRISKVYISGNMELNSSNPVIDGIFHITYIQNTGAAFSMLEGHRLFLIALTALLILGLLVFLVIKGNKEHWSLKLALSLIISGGIGNLIDRVMYGYVVDFMDFRVWPIFNIADVSVCVGCGFLIIYIIFFDKKIKSELN